MKFLKYPISLIIAVVVLFSFPASKQYKQQVDHSIKQVQSIDKWDMLIQSGGNMKTTRAQVKVEWVETFDSRRRIYVQ